jgi:hypothetical protein
MEGGEKKREQGRDVNGVSLGQGRECRQSEVGRSFLDHGTNVRGGWGVEGVDGYGVAWRKRLGVQQRRSRVEVDHLAHQRAGIVQ